MGCLAASKFSILSLMFSNFYLCGLLFQHICNCCFNDSSNYITATCSKQIISVGIFDTFYHYFSQMLRDLSSVFTLSTISFFFSSTMFLHQSLFMNKHLVCQWQQCQHPLPSRHRLERHIPTKNKRLHCSKNKLTKPFHPPPHRKSIKISLLLYLCDYFFPESLITGIVTALSVFSPPFTCLSISSITSGAKKSLTALRTYLCRNIFKR